MHDSAVLETQTRFLPAICSLLATVVAAAAWGAAPTTTQSTLAAQRWAIVSTPELQRTGLPDLVAAKLATTGISLVERDRIDAVLKELTLSEVLGAEGVGLRLKLGKLVGADILVFLRERLSEDKAQTAIEMAVARSDQGVRFRLHYALWDRQKLDSIADELVAELGQAKRLRAREDFQLFAVPPLVSEDVGLQYASKRSGYARLIEQLLVRRDGVAVVELAEAKALAREMAIAGTTIRRNLPYYVIGTYKTAGTWEAWTTVNFGLELRRGETPLGTAKRESVPLAETPRAMREALDELLVKLGGKAAPPPDLNQEANLLVARAAVFGRIGDWDQAMPLYESALLCQSDRRDALLGMVEGYSRLAIKGGFGAITARWLQYSPRGRMEACESAMPYMTALLAKYPLDAELASALDRLAQVFDLPDYDCANDWDNAIPVYMRVFPNLLSAMSGISSGDRRALRPMDGSGRRRVLSGFWEIVREMYRENSEGTRRRITDLVKAMDRPGNGTADVPGQLCAILAAGGQGGINDPAYLRWLDELESQPSKHVGFVVQVARILGTERDTESQQRATSEIRKLTASYGIEADVWDSVGRYRSMLKKPVAKSRPAVAEEKAIVAPQFEEISNEVEIEPRQSFKHGPLSYVLAWKSFRPDLELVATAGGIYRVSSTGRFERFWGGQARRLYWDGRYVWAITSDYISVLEETGKEIIRYHESEVKAMKHSYEFQFAPAAPGELGMLGMVHLEPAGVRSWAGILKWDRMPDGRFKKIVEPFFEAREQRANQTTDEELIKESFIPMWGIDLPRGGPNGEPLLLVSHATQRPLILDWAHRSARLAKHEWPYAYKVVRDGDTVYISPGGSTSQAIYQVQKGDEKPKVVAELHPASSGRLPSWYNAMTVYRDKIHLLGVMLATEKERVEAWIAVDPATGQSYVLADPMPADFTVSELTVSNHYGLVILAHRQAYQVTLPPMETWTPLAACTLTRGLAKPAALSIRVQDPYRGLNAPAGEETKLLRGHTWDVTGVALSPDGRLAASAGGYSDKTVVVWDLATGKALRTLKGHRGGSYGVAFSPDGRYVVSGGYENKNRKVVSELLLWDVQDGRLVRSFPSSEDVVRGVAFTPDGSRILTGSVYGWIGMWDVATGKPLYHFHASPETIWAVAISHDGRLIATSAWGEGGNYIRLGDPNTGREIRKLGRLPRGAQSLEFSPRDDLLLAACMDGLVRLLDVKTGRLIRRFSGDVNGVRAIAFLPGGKYFVGGGGGTDVYIAISYKNKPLEKGSGNPDNDVLLWSIDDGRAIARFKGHVQEVRGVAVSPDGRYAVSASEDHTVRLWTLPAAAELPALAARAASARAARETAGYESSGIVSTLRTTIFARLAWRTVAICGLVVLLGFSVLVRTLRGGRRR